jgi:hypothetical protein
MEIEVSDPSLVGDLVAFLRRAECEAEQVGERTVVATLPRAIGPEAEAGDESERLGTDRPPSLRKSDFASRNATASRFRTGPIGPWTNLLQSVIVELGKEGECGCFDGHGS